MIFDIEYMILYFSRFRTYKNLMKMNNFVNVNSCCLQLPTTHFLKNLTLTPLEYNKTK